MSIGRGLRRLSRETEGSALVETVIALPVLFVFMLVIMELSLLYNGKQLANYAAFCAARTASVYGINSTVKTHMAAAMAMTSISPATAEDAEGILMAYGLDDPDQTVVAICSIPGFQGDNATWMARLANAYVRTYVSPCSTGTAPGKTRTYVVANVTYIYRCTILPFGNVWGHAGLDAYIATLEGLAYYPPGYDAAVKPLALLLQNSWRWNIPIRGRAVTDYWAG